MTRNCIKTYALCSSALVALTYGSSAYAQDVAGTATGGASAEEVVVTGSRVITNGFAAPTPVTVITAQQMEMTAPNSLSDAVNQLPQFKSSFISASTGFLAGAGSDGNYLNLRGLGVQRNLVLMNGERMIAAGENGSSAGAVDLNTIPQSLVSHVDTTTGGGTAEYGSDALTGVVNFVLDTKFTGVKGEIRGSETSYGDDQTGDISLAVGHAFAGDRGHFIASVEYYNTAGIPNYLNRPWADTASSIVTNVACPLPQTSLSCPTRIAVNNLMPANMASGGLVLTGATALKGNFFAGSQATLTKFNYGGNITFPAGSPAPTQTTMVGGGEPQDQNLGQKYSSLPPQSRGNAFLHVSYDVAPNWTVWAEGLYADSQSHWVGVLGNEAQTNTFTILSDNVYLPASVAALMGGPGATSVALVNPATGIANGATRNTFSIGRLDTDWPSSQNYNHNDTLRGSLGIDGKIGVWTVNAYYAHADAIHKSGATGEPDISNLFNAIDAVASPGGAGLPALGTAICRSTITNPTNGCVPVNVLGTNTLTSQQWAYITDGGANGNSQLTQHAGQDVAELNIHGEPFSLWAGPVSLGFGGSYRKESIVGNDDPISNSYNPVASNSVSFKPGLTPILTYNGLPASLGGAVGGWDAINSGFIAANSLDVKEVYGEALIPLAKDMPFLKTLDLNGAIRYADYQYGGAQTNWKVGFSWKPIDDLRVRMTESHDIHAPTLANLFAGRSESNGAVSDPFRLGTTGTPESNANAITYSQGNPALLPEVGDTFTMGAVYSPTWNKWVEGFTASVDYYNIILTNTIGAVSAITQCSAGNTKYCSFIQRDTNPADFGAGNTIGPIQTVLSESVNEGTTKNDGLDIEVSYRLPLSKIWEGRTDIFTFRALFNDMMKNQSFTLGGTSETNSVGIISGGIVGGTGGNSDWSGSMNFNYQTGPLTVNIQERFINKGRINANVDDAGNPYSYKLFVNPNGGATGSTASGSIPNTIPAYFYTDLSINYRFGKDQRYEGYLTINNLFDKDPPAVLGSLFFYGVYPTNISLYDTVGRNFTAGLRFKF